MIEPIMENINPTILILKNGEQIICDLKEVFDGEGENRKGVCLLMTHPHLLSLVNDSSQDLQVKFTKWCPYSTDTQFKIPYDSAMAFGACDSGLSEAFINRVALLQSTEQTEPVINPEVMPNE